ncbi:MAG TPA: hypothetical protein VF971_07670 [Candidatus Limnocylindrales bacterium]
MSLQVVPDSGRPGDELVATASGSPPGPVSFWWDEMDVLLGIGESNGVDPVSVTITIPPGAAVGPHPVWACEGSTCLPGLQGEDIVTVLPPPTPAPTPRPTPRATPTITPGPTDTPAPTETPAPTGPVVPIPSFPVAVPTPVPTPLPLIAVTPAPQPPNGLTVPEVEFPNLRVRAVEVTQGIQNLDNDMPLVRHRRTYVRVHVDVFPNESWPNTWGALEARRNGQQIGWMWPDNGPIIARAGSGDRTSLDDSLLFRIPNSWTSGTVTLTAFVFSYTVETPFTQEPFSADNFRSETVTFQQGEPLTLHLAPLHIHRSYHPSDVERIYSPGLGGGGLVLQGSNLGATERILSGAYRYLPITALNVDSLSTPVTPLGHAGGHEFQLGGVCKSTLLTWASNHMVIADWTVLMEDPSDVDIDAYSVPDRPTIQVMDRVFTATYFYPRDDGTADMWGTSSGFGPNPIPGAPTYAFPCLIITDALHEPNYTLALYRVFYDWSDERELFVGMVHPSLRVAFGGGIATSNTGAVTMRMSDSFGVSYPWDHGGAGTLGHEVGHQAGLGHVPCEDDDSDGIPDEIAGGGLDLTHPMTLTFPDCWLSEVDDDGYYGFDVYWDRFGLAGPTVLSNDPAAPAPNRAFPLLSYRGPGWDDPFHYCRMLSYYGVPCSASALDLPWNPPNPEPDGSDPFAAGPPPAADLDPGVDAALVLVGETPEGGWTLELLARNSAPTLELRERIAAEVAPEPDEDRPWLVVLGPDGAPTWQATIPTPILPHGASGSSPISMVVPLPPDTSAIEVRSWDAQTMARIIGSSETPAVSQLATDIAPGSAVEPDDEILVSFVTGDPDGGPVRATLLYTPDGEHWQVAAADVEGGRARVPVDDLPSGPAPAFRVVAFDGWGIGEGALPVPELAAPRNGPSVMILASGPARYPLGANVRLEAAAFDLEDRALPGEAIAWSSSIGGQLGGGSEIATRDLAPGRHTITATATDSDGLTGSATYILEIDPETQEVLPDAALVAGVAGIFERLAAGLDPAPPAAPSVPPNSPVPWLPIGLLGLVLVLVLGAAVGVARARGFQIVSAGTDAPAVRNDMRSFKSRSGHVLAEPPADLVAHEATHTAQADALPAEDPGAEDPGAEGR